MPLHRNDPETRRLLKRRLELVLHGELTADSLEQLRRNLGFATMDALGETPNTVLGERVERSQQFRTVVEMAMTFTQVGQQDWALTIDAVPRTDIDRWQCLAEIACRIAGLTIIETRTPPPFVLSEDEKREIFEEAGRVMAARQRKLDEIPFSTPFRAFADDFED